MWRFQQLRWKELVYGNVPTEAVGTGGHIVKPVSYIQPELLPRHSVCNESSLTRTLSTEDPRIDVNDSDDSEEEEDHPFPLHC